ncbi:putative ribonuclease H-like domain-containing protein [Tanacetum coccineum]|uniref:Ribonuclease H-like domain-containing protein n=1 Tax=Tanacetum coccineum TaxID=301880 RepID=A0ABQ4WB28_9ASTR
MRPFGCPLTILNTLDSLGKFDGKSDEGYLLGYSTTSKAFRVYNKRTKRVEDSLHITFLEDQPNVAGTGPNWMFDLYFLTNSMNYIPVSVENQVNVDAGTQDSYVVGSSGKDKEPTHEYILLSLHTHRTRIPVEDVAPAAHENPSESSPKDNDVHDSEDMNAQEVIAKALDDVTRQAFEEEKRNIASQKRAAQATSTNKFSTVRSSVSTATTPYVCTASTPTGANADLPIDPNMPDLEDDYDAFSNDGIFNGAYDDENVGAVADFNKMGDTINVSPIPTLRIHKDHPKDQILGDPKSAVQTRGKIQKDSSTQQALILIDFPSGKKAIGTKWVFKNKRDERSIVVKNKARLIAQGFRQEEGINYDEVFAPVARIKAIRLFLAFASYMGFTVYQMDVKSAFLYGTIKEEVYVHTPSGFVDLAHPNKVYKVIKALYDLHQAPRAWYETLSSFLMENGFRRGTIDKALFIKKNKSDIMLVQVYMDDIIFGSTKKSMCTEFEDCMHKRFQMSSMGELTFFLGLQVKQQPDGIFISQDKYVADILKKFDFWSIRTATTPIESNKPLVKDEDGEDVDVHVYRSMIGSLMYLTASRPDIMFAVCACARFQVTPKASHLNAVKRIFRYLKHQPKLGLWYPRDSPFELEAFSDSDYGGASLDRKSTTGGCQFLGRRLISWQCKKQTIVANSTTEAKYVAAANCCGQTSSHAAQFTMLSLYITAKVVRKPMNILEASIRSDLLFDDIDGIDSLHNKAIFDTIQLMGYEGDLTILTFNKALISPQWIFLFHIMNHCISSKSTYWDQIPTNIATAVICLATNQKYNFSKLIFDGMMRHLDAKKKFVMYPRFISVFLDKHLKNGPVPLDHFPINALTSKVFSFMVKKGKYFSGNVTPLFESMLVQPTEDEGESSERQSEPQPPPSPLYPSADQHETQLNPSPRPLPTIPIPDFIPEGSGRNHGGQSSSDRSLSGNEDGLTLQSIYDLCVSLYKQVTDQAKEIKHLKAQIKKLNQKAKPVITHHKAWMKSGRKPAKSEPTVHKDPAFDDLDDVDVNDAMDYMETDAYMQKGVSTEDQVSTVKPDEGTDKPDEDQVSTVKPDEGTDKPKVSTDKHEVSTAKPKKVEVSTDKLDEGTAEPKDGTSDESTAPTTIFRDDETIAEFLVSMSQTKAKQKGVEIKDAEDSDRTQSNEEEAESDAESEGVDEAERKFDQLSKDEEIARKAFGKKRFLAQQRAAAIRSRLPTRTQLRNQMMTYLKYVGGKKHADLKNKNFKEIQVLYKEVKRFDKNFIAIGSAEDERHIKEMKGRILRP